MPNKNGNKVLTVTFLKQNQIPEQLTGIPNE